MNRIVMIFAVLIYLDSPSLCQSDKHTTELFTNHIGRTTSPAQAYIPGPTCSAIIQQADRLVTSEGLKTSRKTDLAVASLNLRTCATSDLPRSDRDLAVGLYGEVVSELERRERAEKPSGGLQP